MHTHCNAHTAMHTHCNAHTAMHTHCNAQALRCIHTGMQTHAMHTHCVQALMHTHLLETECVCVCVLQACNLLCVELLNSLVPQNLLLQSAHKVKVQSKDKVPVSTSSYVLAGKEHAVYRYIHRVGQIHIYTPYITVYLVISLPKTPYMHRIYTVLANLI
jgi:hypothetical protein